MNKAPILKQVLINDLDIIAVISQVQKQMLLVVSVYILCNTRNKKTDRKNLEHWLNLIQDIYQTENSQYFDLKIFLTGDFNR